MTNFGMNNKFTKRQLLRTSSKCHWCNKQLLELTATVDHVISLRNRGSTHISNCVLSCLPCNTTRSLIEAILAGQAKQCQQHMFHNLLRHVAKCSSYDPLLINPTPLIKWIEKRQTNELS